MLLTIDHHIHSKYSDCCRGNYDFHDIVQAVHARNLRYYCVSDHVHSDADTGAISLHHSALRNIPEVFLDRPVFIGAEVTFCSRQGDYPDKFQPADPKPAFLIGGCHKIPGTAITMRSIPRSIEILQTYEDHELSGIFAIHHEMLCGAVKKGAIDILAHPYDIFFRCGIFDSRQLEMFVQIARLCREHDVAIEINNASMTRCFYRDSEALTLATRYSMPPRDFYTRMLRIALEEGKFLSPASDAHTLSNVGNMNQIERLMTEMGIPEERLLYLDRKNNECS
jgi:histidinol phosphatase-like PHP family hydrolase